MSRVQRIIVQFAVVLLILAAGGGIAYLLWATRPAPTPRPVTQAGLAVSAVAAKPTSEAVVVRAFGTVRPHTRVQIVPQVAGKVIERHPNLRPGGEVQAGELLIQIDKADFELKVQQADAAMAEAQRALEVERAEAAVARAEWEQLNPGRDPPPLLVREPQINQAEAQLRRAEAILKEAQLDEQRTTLRAPVTGIVSQQMVDVGEFVQVGQTLAQMYATDRMEVVVPLEDSLLRWFNVPGARVNVSATFRGGLRQWDGTAARLEGEADEVTRTLNLVVDVDDIDGDHGVRLIPNLFVDVAITGDDIEEVEQLPRYALRPGNRLWLARDGALVFKDVEVVRQSGDSVYVRGIDAGEVVITSDINVPTEGLPVRVLLQEAPGEVAAPTPAPATQPVAQRE